MRRKYGRVLPFCLVTLVVACGSRTGLFGGDDDETGPGPFDSGLLGDSSGFHPDVMIPSLDSGLPPIDAAPRDASRIDCPDADATLVYVVTDSYQLYSYFPTDGSFTFISNIACPSNGSATPFSMAVDRKGIAYVAYNDGNLYRVSTATGACIPTTFQPHPTGTPFDLFGMGFATNAAGPTESLYVASSDTFDLLGRIDTTSFGLTTVGSFVPVIHQAELTGTGDGRLFAFYNKNDSSTVGNPPPSFIGEIDTTTARVVAETGFPTVGQGNGWAFAFWGGDFYMFTSESGAGSDVTRYRPADGSTTVVGSLPAVIVGAGVSTCAPAE